MADYSITVAQVGPGSGAITETKIAGATITAGQTLYLDTTTNTIKLAVVTTSAATATVCGIALHGALAGQPITYQKGGNIILGTSAVGTVGDMAILGGSAGGIAPVADNAAADFACFLGYWNSTGKQLVLAIAAPSQTARAA